MTTEKNPDKTVQLTWVVILWPEVKQELFNYITIKQELDFT